MSKLLEIFGKGLTINTADVVMHWIGRNLSQEPDSDDVQLLREIHDCLANRRLVQAEKKTREFLESFPDCVMGRMAAAAVCLYQDDLEEAIQQAHSIYYREPANTMALYIMGYCHERLGHIDQALEFYQDCVKFKSYLQLPRKRMAAIYFKEGHLERAVREYEILTSEHPEDISSMILLGHLYLEADQASKAIDTFNLAILSHPDNFMDTDADEETQFLVESGMFEQALEMVKYSIEQMGPTQDLLIRMGDIYSHWEKESQAIACYEYAIRVEPNSLEGRIKLGTHYLRNQRFSLAAEEFNTASEVNDEILDAYLGLASAQYKFGMKEDSLQNISLASSIQKNSILLFTEAAILQFQSVIDEEYNIDPESDKNVVVIGHVIKAYQRQLKNCGNNADTQEKYGKLMVSENKLQAAICAFENALAANPMNYRVRHDLAICFWNNGQHEKALEMLDGNECMEAGSLEKYYQMSMLYADKQRFAAAMKNTCVKKCTETSDAKQVRGQLENILETLGIIDRSYINWERINETATGLCKVFEGDSHSYKQH